MMLSFPYWLHQKHFKMIFAAPLSFLLPNSSKLSIFIGQSFRDKNGLLILMVFLRKRKKQRNPPRKNGQCDVLSLPQCGEHAPHGCRDKTD